MNIVSTPYADEPHEPLSCPRTVKPGLIEADIFFQWRHMHAQRGIVGYQGENFCLNSRVAPLTSSASFSSLSFFPLYSARGRWCVRDGEGFARNDEV